MSKNTKKIANKKFISGLIDDLNNSSNSVVHFNPSQVFIQVTQIDSLELDSDGSVVGYLSSVPSSFYRLDSQSDVLLSKLKPDFQI
jgi:hypothetical protein